VFRLYPGRGPVVQPHPSWPVACTATCYAAASVGDAVVTGDYAAQGPHFLDWKSLAEKGCVSMAAVPMFSCNRPVAVLCLASDKVSRAAPCHLVMLRASTIAAH
jgi:GAF domain-containing protein